MISILGDIPKEPLFVAVSGGVDSMAIYDFLRSGKHKVKALFVNHNTEASTKAYQFLMDYLKGDFYAEQISQHKPKEYSWEEFWRIERYKIFKATPNSHESVKGYNQVITAHHLDDQVEQWIFSSLHGKPGLIPYRNANVIRPFLPTPKSELIEWAERKGVKWIDDQSNGNVAYARNRIRHNIVPESLAINPGLHKVIYKKVVMELTVS